MTRQVTHTLPDDVLLAYSTGRLSEVFDLVVASHVSLSDDSRARLGAFDAIGGAVLDDIAPVAMADDSLEATLARITGHSPEITPAVAADATLPAPLHDYIGGDLASVRWRPIGMGARQSILHEDGPASVRLLSIPVGAELPDHGHGGMEMTLVLQGAFADEFGEFHRGDVEIADETMEHTPRVIGTTPCICLAAADNHLRFNGWLPRMMQRFIRI